MSNLPALVAIAPVRTAMLSDRPAILFHDNPRLRGRSQPSCSWCLHQCRVSHWHVRILFEDKDGF